MSFRTALALALAGLGLLLAPIQPARADLTPRRLTCEHRIGPLGLDETKPRLGWIVESAERGEKQTAYRILVSSSPESLGQDQGGQWDTGKVQSDETIQIVYDGTPLVSHQQVFWKVMVWDRDGQPSAWSDPAAWTMGLLDARDWSAKWIGLDRLRRFNLSRFLPRFLSQLTAPITPKRYDPSPYLRKAFAVNQPVKRAVVYVTALGLYELHLNGQRVGQDYFTPGWTDYRQRVHYLTYDVTGLVVPGDNALGAILADGWYAGNIGLVGQHWYGSDLRLRAQLRLEFEDGEVETVATDDSWRASDGPVREADIQAGEIHDARLAMPGWSSPGFDDRDWDPVDVTENVNAPVQAYPGIPVRRTGEIKPVSMTEPKPGVFVFNLGQNFAGWARLRVKGQAGDKIVLRFAEMLNPDGTIYTKNLRGARATDTYIVGGLGDEVFEPRFTYHGFQYVEVTGYPGRPALDDVTGVVAHSDLTMTGSFSCSDALVNKIHSNLVWGQRSNYFEVPTDCPQRDERLGWTGDAEVFLPTAAYNMNVEPFFTKWLVDLNDGQFADGRYPDVAPNVLTGAAAGWGDAGVICPWTIHKVYADRRAVEAHYDNMKRFMSFMEGRSLGQVSPPLGTYGDWLNVKDPTPLDLIATAYFGHDARLMAEMARAVGRDDDARHYQTLYENIGQAFTAAYVDGDGRIKGDSQTAYVLALRFGLVPGEKRPLLAAQLVGRIEDRDWLLSTGFLGAGSLLPTLTDIGRTDVAYRLLTNTRYPSWGYSIEQGATTMWERWNSYTVEDGFESAGMNSFNHYAYGAVGEWIYSTLAGIDNLEPGYKRIVIRPLPGGGIDWAKASYDSIRGPVSTSWKLDGADLTLEVTIPANTSAMVHVPAKAEADVFEGGAPAARSAGVSFLAMDGGAAVFEVGSGTYAFVSSGWKETK